MPSRLKWAQKRGTPLCCNESHYFCTYECLARSENIGKWNQFFTLLIYKVGHITEVKRDSQFLIKCSTLVTWQWLLLTWVRFGGVVTTIHTLTALGSVFYKPAPLASVPDDCQWGPLVRLYSEAPSLNGSHASRDFNAGISTYSFISICCRTLEASLLPLCSRHGINGTEPSNLFPHDEEPFMLLQLGPSPQESIITLCVWARRLLRGEGGSRDPHASADMGASPGPVWFCSWRAG